MANFSVNINRLENCTNELERRKREIESCARDIMSVYSRMNTSYSYQGIRRQLTSISSTLNTEAQKVRVLNSGLGSAIRQYVDAENKVMNSDDLGIVEVKGTSIKRTNSGSNDKEDSLEVIQDFMIDLVGGAGVIGKGGAIISSIMKAITKPNAKNIVSSGKYVANLAEGIADYIASPDMLKLVGLNVEPQKKFLECVKESIWKNIDDVGDAVNTTAAKASNWLKNAGNILTVATEAVENFSDEENSFGRALAETVGESAFNIVIGAGATALLSTVGAPALVVGAGVAAVSCVVSATKLDEKVSDFFIDGAVNVGKTVKNVVGNATQAVGNFAKSVGAKWKKFCFG